MHMKSIRNLLAGSALAAGALVTAAAGISIATAADVATTAAPAAPAAPGPHAWHHHGFGHLYAQLNLTADQKAQMKNIMMAAAPQMKSIHQQMHANSLKLRQTQPNDPNYATTVSQVSEANAPLFAQMTTQKAEIRASMFKILTPAQQTQLQALEVQMQNRPHGTWAPRAGATPPAAAQ
jgi:periplasmic protein CpxP/Spy